MPAEDDWGMEPCLRKFECEPTRNGGEWKCGFCGVEMLMMRVVRPEPEPTAEVLAERAAQATRLAGLMTDPQVRIAEELLESPPVGMAEMGEKGMLPGESDEQMITRISAVVRAEPEPRQNAGGPGCWRTEEGQ